MRKATLSAQKERDDQRSARERIIAERVLAAKNRQRARLGLPPLEKMDEPEPLKLEEKATEEAAKKSANKSEEDSAKELERKSHLRPWDEGKEGTSHLVSSKDVEAEWAYKAPREPMSQEKWNETKRGERKSEFAPTPDLNASPKTKKGKRKEGTDAESPTKPEPTVAAPDVPMMDDAEDEVEERPGLYFTTKKKKLKRRNYQPEDTSPPRSSGGAEIPPPPTFDYYGPPLVGLSSKRPKPEPASSLVTSIEAGLKFLRNQTDKSQSSSQSLWGANANYGKDM